MGRNDYFLKVNTKRTSDDMLLSFTPVEFLKSKPMAPVEKQAFTS